MLLLLACTPPDGKGPDDTQALVDSEGVETGETALDTSQELNGSWPEEAVPLPSFTALNRDGSERGPQDLTGHLTVMWFYPAAGTFG